VDDVLDHAVEAVVVIVAHQAALALAQSLRIGVPLVLVEGSPRPSAVTPPDPEVKPKPSDETEIKVGAH